ncbi:hypothetical protein EMIHUDRAFT_40952, partial [Emiliania huxleyi CCMP1516]|uniref:Suppressor of forked domain-containing protein n=2 Tax=Emiliania huxleyi TaxID=2903 RepID=A0A0D3JHA0_EMIH1
LDESDLLFEEDILRNAYSLKYWWRYMEAKKRSPARQRNLIAERALKYLPGCYKIWHAYLADRRAQCKAKEPGHPAHARLNAVYERALVYMHKMPRIWLDYLEILAAQHAHTTTRRAFDRALRALPVTQHERIWKLYLPYAKASPVPEAAVRIYKRRAGSRRERERESERVPARAHRLESRERAARVCRRQQAQAGRGSRATRRLVAAASSSPRPHSLPLPSQVLNREGFVSLRGKSRHKLVQPPPTPLPQVRDFSMVFDAYSQFEESLITALIERQAQQQAAADLAAAESGGASAEASKAAAATTLELDMRLERLERLMERRPELLSSVLLRQNPHSVHEWLKRASLFEASPAKAIQTYAAAVDPRRAVGRPSSLWLGFAKFYESHGDIKNARAILRKARPSRDPAETQPRPSRSVDELASIWMGWSEMELRHKKYPEALAVLAEATAVPPASRRAKEKEGPVQDRLYKFTKLWAFYADLQESLAGFEPTRVTYDKMIELRIVTPQLVLNYAAFLEEHKHFELAFQAHRPKGVALFKYPHALPLWLSYLTKFTARFGGAKLERGRDLFEQARFGRDAAEREPETSPRYSRDAAHGLARNAMAVYDRAAGAVALEKRASVYQLYIAKAAEYFGVTKTRDIYEAAAAARAAIGALPSSEAPSFCLRYANLERKLGEIDRARAIYMHGAQEVDPAVAAGSADGDVRPSAQAWHDFEVSHGNEDTFREMLRLKRTVRASF